MIRYDTNDLGCGIVGWLVGWHARTKKLFWKITITIRNE
jgi:hypothetical protein